MRTTITVIKADIGSIGGHTVPSPEVIAIVEEQVRHERGRLLIDAHVAHTGDDIAILMTHAPAASSAARWCRGSRFPFTVGS